MADTAKLKKSKYKVSLEEAVRNCEEMRRDSEDPQDVTLAEYVQSRWSVGMDSFYDDLGINPAIDTIQNIVTMPDPSVRWLIPELFRDALRLGMRKAPIYPDLIAATQNIKGLQITQPAINMSDAAPQYVGIAETIRVGDISYQQKTVHLRKLGRGIKIPYEITNFVSLNVTALFLQDFGVKLGQGKDTLFISTLINGEQLDGSESAPTVGIATANALIYKDLLTVFMRLGRIGKIPKAILTGETSAINLLNLPEYKLRMPSGVTYANLNVKSPIPNQADVYLHAAVPASQMIVIDPSQTMIEYNAQPLLVETEKIISNQTTETFATLITGFGIAFRDARVVIDTTLAFGSGHGFPSYMDPALQEIVTFGK